MINNRQNGRRRGRGVGGGGGGGVPRPGGQDRGNRIDNRARGNASQLHEKYKSLARDMQQAGDRVMTEYYLQFADHYFRVLGENRPRAEEGARRERFEGQDFDEDGGDEFEFNGEERGSDDRQDRNDRQERAERPDRSERRPERAQDGQRDGNREAGREGARDDRPRDARPRDDRPRDDRPRDDRPREAREDRPREDRPRRDAPREVANGHAPEAVIETQPELPVEPVAAAPAVAPEAEAPRRGRGRPRRVVPVDAAPSDDDAEPTFDAALLPPAINPTDDGAAGEEGAEKPRRRRGRPRREEAAPAEA